MKPGFSSSSQLHSKTKDLFKQGRAFWLFCTLEEKVKKICPFTESNHGSCHIPFERLTSDTPYHLAKRAVMLLTQSLVISIQRLLVVLLFKDATIEHIFLLILLVKFNKKKLSFLAKFKHS